ncbi:MAG: flagella basal body P-ring formation protein FlgA [Candidatus Tectimicrobiota bacterium]
MRARAWRQRHSCRRLLYAGLCGVLGSLAPAWGASTLITALPEAVVQGPTIRLGDVAQVQSEDAALLRRLQEIVLGPTPPLGVTRLLSRATMLIQLRHQGIAPQAVEFQGVSQVRVNRAAQQLPLDALEAAARQGLSQQLRQLAPALSIRDIRGLTGVSVSPGPVHYTVLVPSRLPRSGSLPFTLSIEVAGKIERQLTGRAFLQGPQESTSKAAPAGAQRTAAALAPRQAQENPQPVRPPTRAMPPVVQRGDLVQIVSEASLMKVSTPGEVLEAGRVGDTIRVKITAS